jgi:hypothetical protein
MAQMAIPMNTRMSTIGSDIIELGDGRKPIVWILYVAMIESGYCAASVVMSNLYVDIRF